MTEILDTRHGTIGRSDQPKTEYRACHSYRNAAAGSNLAAWREGNTVAKKLIMMADPPTSSTSEAKTWTGMREM
jgi:hypothetical protein